MEKFFKIKERGSDVRTEIIAGKKPNNSKNAVSSNPKRCSF